MSALVPVSAQLPALIAAAGDRAAYRFLEFFTAQIRNPNTRRAYVRAVGDFMMWLERMGVGSIADVKSIHVAAYIEDLDRHQSAPSTKQSLVAIRQLFDWLATGRLGHRAPRSLISRTASTLNSRPNFRRCICHLRLHENT
jgi:site-specific recombinase XerD